MRRHTALPIAALVLLCSARLAAQGRDERVLLGPAGGFGLGPQFGSIPAFAGSEDCGTFRSGSVHGPWGGARLLMPSFFSDRVGLSAMASWRMLRGDLTATPVDRQLATDPASGELITLDRVYRLTTSSSALQIDLLADYPIAPTWHVFGGPWLGSQLSFSSTQVDSIRGPGRSAFAGGERSRAMSEGIAFTPGALGYGLTLAAAAELPVGGRAALLPEISLRATLSSPAKEAWWGNLVAGAGLSVLFDLRAAPAPRDTIAPPPRIPRLAATVRIDGVDEHGARQHLAAVTLGNVSYRTFTPLIPAIFFDANSALLAERYARDTSDAAARFAADTLGPADALDVHHHMLDIIGARLAGAPAATLTLYGSGSSEENESVVGARSRAVKAYLTGRWNVAPSRIAIAAGPGPLRQSGESGEDGKAENRRVEIVASAPSILAPVVSVHSVREFNPPGITLAPAMDAEAGVRRWSIRITQGGQSVYEYSGGANGGGASEITWKIADVETGDLPSPIGVDLTVEDSTGATVAAHDEMPIVVERHDKVIDHTINSLVGFEYNSPEPGEADRALLKAMAATIGPGSRVRVTGYTDRIGDEAYNADLSRRRAERAASLLRDALAAGGVEGVEVTAEAGGVETRRFGNDLPEGRMLSRGVEVVVIGPR